MDGTTGDKGLPSVNCSRYHLGAIVSPAGEGNMRKNLCHQAVIASRTLLLGALLALPASAQTAQQPVPARESGVSITPFMAMGDDYALGGGMSISFPMARRLTLEAEGSVESMPPGPESACSST